MSPGVDLHLSGSMSFFTAFFTALPMTEMLRSSCRETLVAHWAFEFFSPLPRMVTRAQHWDGTVASEQRVRSVGHSVARALLGITVTLEQFVRDIHADDR